MLPMETVLADVVVRKTLLVLEEIFHEGGPPAAIPLHRAAAIAVIRNPFSARYHTEIAPFMETLKPLGLAMAQRLIAALGGNAAIVEGYGKGAIVGEGGEIEHGALWHVPGGYAMREALGGAKAIVPSTRRSAGLARGSMCRSPISTLPTSAAILMRWR